jgi:hypothetical protein
MAGNSNVAWAEAHLSLAKERVRVDPKTQQLVPIPQLDAFPLSQGRGAKRKHVHQFNLTRASTRSLQPTTSCGWQGSKALQIVCFSLVTLTRLLY